MKVLRNEKGSKNREYWDFIERTSREVDSWPAWKTGQGAPATPQGPSPVKNSKDKGR